MRLKSIKTMRQAARWLRSRWGQQVLILGYHRVANVDYDPYDVVVRPSHFAEQMAVLRQEANPISLAKAYEGLRTGNLPRRAVVVTFDDGYTDVLSQAWPLLARYEIPATTFVVADCLGKELWWDELARIILFPAMLPDQLHLNINGRLHTWSVFEAQRKNDLLRKQAPTPRRRLLLMLYQALVAQPEVRLSVMAELHAWSQVNQTKHSLSEIGRMMSQSQLEDLTESGLMEIGSHTMTHAILASLSADAQVEEIRQSKSILEEITRRPVTSFSYPHGSMTAVTGKLVQEAGYLLACTSQNDIVHLGSDPFYLPRFWPTDSDGETFARWLRRWLHG